MTGGGSGGHITPILAVAHEIKQLHPDTHIMYIGQRGDVFGKIVAESTLIDETHTVSAGKFRRYHGEGLRQLLDIRTFALNIRDGFRVIAGLWQSYRLLSQLRPDIIFCKGGFVGVPVGLAAAYLHIPYMTHDSDAIPGLANRIIARWAVKHAVALDPSLYAYPVVKTINVGVPVAEQYQLVDAVEQAHLRTEVGLSEYDEVVLVTGGGLGAARLNHAAVRAAPELLRRFPRLAIVHTTGRQHEAVITEAYEASLKSAELRRVHVIGYTTELYKYSGAADVVVARGGATNLAELASQAKACVIVPNPLLTGGHQLKNAIAYEQKGAIISIDENQLRDNHELLLSAVERLLDNPKLRVQLGSKLHTFARNDSASILATMLFDLGKDKSGVV